MLLHFNEIWLLLETIDNCMSVFFFFGGGVLSKNVISKTSNLINHCSFNLCQKTGYSQLKLKHKFASQCSTSTLVRNSVLNNQSEWKTPDFLVAMP